MTGDDVCTSKQAYDGEFAAERAASIAEYKWREPMMHYKCGNHWHIAHQVKKERNKYPRRPKKDWCDACQQVINPVRYWKHIQTGSHKKLEAKLKEKDPR